MATPTQGYSLDGKRIPSVTTILGVGLGGYAKDALLHWAWKEGKEGRDYRETRDKAADAGIVAHTLIESALRGITVTAPCEPDVMDQAMRCVDAFNRWRLDHDVTALEQEVPLTSRKHRFGGTLDCLGTLDGVVTLFDWKSSKALYQSYIAQVAAYYILVTENRPQDQWPQQAVIVRVGKDGGLRTLILSKADLQIGWRAFQAALQVYRVKTDLERILNPEPIASRAPLTLPVLGSAAAS